MERYELLLCKEKCITKLSKKIIGKVGESEVLDLYDTS